MRTEGDLVLFDLNLTIITIDPEQELILWKDLYIKMSSYSGATLYDNVQLDSWTEPYSDGVRAFHIDSSSRKREVDINDTIRITGMDARFRSAFIDLRWTEHGDEMIARQELPGSFVYVSDNRIAMNDNKTMSYAELSVYSIMFKNNTMEWSEIEIELRHQWNRELDKFLVPKPNALPYNEEIIAYYIDDGPTDGYLDVNESMIITGLTNEYENATVHIRFKGESIFWVIRLPI
jgi:hypothetical protein